MLASFNGETTAFLLPMFEGFLRKRLERGLSNSDADEPDTKEGVRAGSKRVTRDVVEGFICGCGRLFMIFMDDGSLRAGGAISRRNSSPTTLLTPLMEGARLTCCCDGTLSLMPIGLLLTSLLGITELLVVDWIVEGRAGRRLEGIGCV